MKKQKRVQNNQEKENKKSKKSNKTNKTYKNHVKEMLPILVILLMLAIGAYMYPLMPDTMPTHWNTQGQVNGQSSKAVALFLIPVIVLITYLVLSAIPYLSRYHENIVNFKHFFGLKLAIVLFLFVLYITTILYSTGYKFSIINLIIPAMAALFFYLGYVLKDVKRNYFIGVRTPWTLASDEVWDKTHKATSKFMQACAFFMFLGLLVPKYSFIFVIIPAFALIIFSFVYSFVISKKLNSNTNNKNGSRLSKNIKNK